MEILAIKNKGVMEIEALTVMGLSTKRDDDSLIGMFGTGNKYAISVFLREGFVVDIVTSNWHGTFIKSPAEFRGVAYDKISLHVHESMSKHVVHELGITAQMGLKWKTNDALREFVCNARDEGGYEHRLFKNEKECVKQCNDWMDEGDCTTMIVRAKPDNSVLSDYIKKYDDQYLFGRVPIYEDEYGDSNIGIYEKRDRNGPLRIYKNKVLVFEHACGSVCDYELNAVEIDEGRHTSRYEADFEMGVFMFQLPKEIFEKIYSNMKNGYFESMLSHFIIGEEDSIPERMKKSILCTAELYENYRYKLAGREVMIIPQRWYEWCKTSSKLRTLHDEFGETGLSKGKDYKYSELDIIERKIITSAFRFVRKAGYELKFKELRIKDIEGAGAFHENLIYLDKKSLARGVRETVDTIIHEIIHRDSKESDFTNGFQNALVREIVRQAMLRLEIAL